MTVAPTNEARATLPKMDCQYAAGVSQQPSSWIEQAAELVRRLAGLVIDLYWRTRYHATLVYFLDKLKATPDGDGNLLDHSLILFGSGMSNSNEHNHNPLPLLLAGSASGAVKGGRHIRVAKDTTHSNLLLTILHKAGVRAEKFGDSTGIIEQL